jgi:hypothetical protein
MGVQGYPHAGVGRLREFGSEANIEEIAEWFHLTQAQIVTVLEFAARSLDAPAPVTAMPETADARPL